MKIYKFKNLKCLTLQLLAAIFVIAFSMGAFAQGWTDVSGDWYYLDKNGQAYANSFVEKDGVVLFLDEVGRITRNRLFEFNDHLYYAKNDGSIAKNEFVDVSYDEAKEIGFQEGRYYFGEDGKSIKKTGSSFKKLIEGSYYAFDENGVLLVGWLDQDGNLLNQDEILTEGIYCTDENGVLKKNRWYDFVNDIGMYDNERSDNTLNAVEFDNMKNMWMYFDDKCKKVKATTLEKEKKKNINGLEYAFDENGIMLIYFTKAGGLDLTQASNPTAKNKPVMYSEADGQLAKDSWFWLYPSKELDEKEYYGQEMHWWHTDKSGKLYTNALKEIEGKKYVFDGIGRMKAGFVLFDGKKYVANYMPEDLTREDFLYSYDQGSRLYGHELSDIRYFGDDDKNDGSMRKGEVQVELSDEVCTFCFQKDGKVYASRNAGKPPKKIKGVYYTNGLRLNAIKDKKYGFVCVSSASDAVKEYKLVDKNGKVTKKSKKVCVDDDGNYILLYGEVIVGYKLDSDMPGPDVSIKWRNATEDDPAGFYYYDKDTNISKDHYHYGLCLDPQATPTITDSDLQNLPEDMRVNFK